MYHTFDDADLIELIRFCTELARLTERRSVAAEFTRLADEYKQKLGDVPAATLLPHVRGV